MKQHPGLRPLFHFLMAAAAISFTLCLFSDIQMSIGHTALPRELVVAVSWLVGHGLHGSIVVLLPVAYFLSQHSPFMIEEQTVRHLEGKETV